MCLKEILGITPLHQAALRGHFDIFFLTLPYVQDKNPRDNIGMTPLHFATAKGYFGICKYIMEFLDDINPKTNDGLTPLDLAYYCQHFEIYQLLRKRKIELQLKLYEQGYEQGLAGIQFLFL